MLNKKININYNNFKVGDTVIVNNKYTINDFIGKVTRVDKKTSSCKIIFENVKNNESRVKTSLWLPESIINLYDNTFIDKELNVNEDYDHVNMKFQVGDTVIVNGQIDAGFFDNEIGVIVSVDDDYFDLGVRFNRPIKDMTNQYVYGHSCEDACEDGYGWFVPPENISLYRINPYDDWLEWDEDINEEFGTVMMNHNYMHQYPYQLQYSKPPSDITTIDGGIKNKMFDYIQEVLKKIISEETNIKDPKDIQSFSDLFFNIGKNNDIKKIVDNCSGDYESCAREIFKKYHKNVEITFNNKSNNNINPLTEKKKNDMSNNYDGKYGFKMFLYIICLLKNTFIKTKDYDNIKGMDYFFSTDNISNIFKLLDMVDKKRSLKKTRHVLNKIKDERLSFYFSINKLSVEYGFLDEMKLNLYKCGEFKTTTAFLKSIDKYSCNKLIKKFLQSFKS
jgi:hypothetical protein